MSGAAYGLDVLAVGPHPDDVEIFCGGVMLVLAARGYRTGIVDLTRGELASRGTVDERAKEAEAAGRILGLALRENLALPDGAIDPSPASPHLPPVVAAIRRHRPELLLVPWHEERHPDHVAAAALLRRAVFLSGLRRLEAPGGDEPFRPRQVLHYEMRYRMPATFIVDTSAVAERKAEAVACHRSQLARPEGGAPTLIGSPHAWEMIEARDRYRGSQIGRRRGEALFCSETPGLVDPVAHFRANAFPLAHAFETGR